MKNQPKIDQDQDPRWDVVISNYFKLHNDRVVRHARSMVKNLEDAEDIAQDVWEKARRLIHTYDNGKCEFGTWLYTITLCKVRDFLESKNEKYKSYPVSNWIVDGNGMSFQFNSPKSSEADTQVLNSELKQRILTAFRELNRTYRRIAVMFFLNDLSHNDIATALDMPLGTVKVSILRARTTLQEQLDGLYILKSEKHNVVMA